MKHQPPHSGFTLLELLLYVSLAAILIGGATTFYITATADRERNQNIQQVEIESMNALETVGQAIRDSVSIITPLDPADDTELVLEMRDQTKNPTIVSEQNGTLEIQEGLNDPVPLTSPQVVVNYFQARNMGGADTPTSVRIEMSVDAKIPNNSEELIYTNTYYATTHTRP